IDKVRRDLQINLQINSSFNFRESLPRPHFFNRPFQHLAIKVKPDRFDVSMLLSAKKISRSPQLQVECGDSESCTEFREFPDGGKTAPRDRSQCFVRRNQEICVSTAVGSSDTSAQLIKLRQSIAVGPIDDQGIGKRYIETIFNDCCGDQDIELMMHEPQHN